MSMEDLAGANTLPILGGSLGKVLSDTVWSVMEEGENHVLFAQELNGRRLAFRRLGKGRPAHNMGKSEQADSRHIRNAGRSGGGKYRG